MNAGVYLSVIFFMAAWGGFATARWLTWKRYALTAADRYAEYARDIVRPVYHLPPQPERPTVAHEAAIIPFPKGTTHEA